MQLRASLLSRRTQVFTALFLLLASFAACMGAPSASRPAATGSPAAATLQMPSPRPLTPTVPPTATPTATRTPRPTATATPTIFPTPAEAILAANASRLRIWSRGGSGRVVALAWSFDGRSFAIASTVGIKVYDAATQAEMRHLQTEGIRTVAWSRDAAYLAAGTSTGAVVVWPLAEGDEPRVFAGHKSVVTAIVFSADGGWLVSADEAGQIIVWDRLTGQVRATTEADSYAFALAVWQETQAVVFAEGGEHLSIKRWAPEEGGKTETLARLSEFVNEGVFSADGHVFAVELGSRGLVYDLTTGTPPRRFFGLARYGVLALAISPAGDTMAAGSSDGVMVIDVQTGDRSRTLYMDRMGVSSLALAPDQRMLLSANGIAATLWDLEDGHAVRSWQEWSGSAVDADVAPDGATLAVHFSDGSVRLLSIPSFFETRSLPVALTGWGSVWSVKFSPDGAYLAKGGASEGNAIELVDPRTGALLHTIPTQGMAVDMAFSSDSESILWSDYNQAVINMWDIPTGTLRRWPKEKKAGPVFMAISPGGSTLAYETLSDATGISKLILWDLARDRQIASIDHQAGGLAFSWDGRLLAYCTASGGGAPVVIDLATLRAVRTLPIRKVAGNCLLAFSPDGTLLAATTLNPNRSYGTWSMGIWSIVTGKPVFMPEGYVSMPYTSLAFTPDGRLLIAGDDDGQVVAWGVDRLPPRSTPR